MSIWVPAIDIASLMGISSQRLRYICSKIASGQGSSWRGAQLIVRQVHGRGGRSGEQYQVSLDSLPVELQQRWNALQTPSEQRLKHGPKARQERDWWHGVLLPALNHDKGTPERASAVRAIAATRHMRPDGRWENVSERTIQRKLQRFDATNGDIGSLSRTKRVDAGAARVILTAKWDRNVPFGDAEKDRIAAHMRSYVASLYKAGEQGMSIRMLAQQHLVKMTQGAGCTLPQAELVDICSIPDNFIRAQRVYRKVRKFNADRKAYEDKERPRIQRHRQGYQPMDIVVADIHPIDILVRREDGSTATPRAIAWFDIATNRVWMDVVLLEKGEGIRNAHVIASFIHMVKSWGAPRSLYLDNGSEYNWAEFIDDALKLIDRDGNRYTGTIAHWNERGSQIIRATPYNAAAKPIEGVFGILEKYHFSLIPGWIGGNRMNKKTGKVGREPEPFPGTFEELRAVVMKAVEFYELMPTQKRGTLAGKSPREAYNMAVQDGWTKTDIEADALRVAFSTRETRQIRQGVIQYGGKQWTSYELQACLDDTVTVLAPKYENWERLPVLGGNGELLCFVEENRAFGFLDPAGAQEASKRQATRKKAVRTLDRSVPDIDPLEERANFVAGQTPALPAPVGATVTHSADAARIAAELKISPEDRAERERRKVQEEYRQRLRLYGIKVA